MTKGSNYLYFMLAALFFTSAYAMFEDNPEIKVLNNMTELNQVASNLDYLGAVYFFTDSEKCHFIADRFIEFAEDSSELFKFYGFNCDKIQGDKIDLEKVPVCAPEYLEHLPTVVFFKPARYRFDPKDGTPQLPEEHYYKGEAESEALSTFAKDLMPSFTDSAATKKALDRALEDTKIPNKVLLFTTKSTLPPIFKALSSQYRDRLHFVEIAKENKEVIDLYKITKYPALIILKKIQDKDSYEAVPYTGSISYGKLQKFLKPYALKDREYPESTMTIAEHDTSFYDIEAAGFLETINKYEKPIVVHIYKDQKHPMLEKFRKKYDALFGYFHLDVEQAENLNFAKEKLKVKSYPSIVVFKVGEKSLTNRLVISKTDEMDEIHTDLLEFIGDKSETITQDDFQTFLQNTLTTREPYFIMYFTDPNDLLPIMIASQIPRYQKTMRIAKFYNPAESTMKIAGVKELPHLMVSFLADPYVKHPRFEDLKVAHFTGKFNSKDLYIYFDQSIVNKKREQDVEKTKQKKADEDL